MNEQWDELVMGCPIRFFAVQTWCVTISLSVFYNIKKNGNNEGTSPWLRFYELRKLSIIVLAL